MRKRPGLAEESPKFLGRSFPFHFDFLLFQAHINQYIEQDQSLIITLKRRSEKE